MEQKLTPMQAFIAMTCFLDDFYFKTKSDDAGSLLGDMSFLEDGGTVDLWAWSFWEECVDGRQVLTKQEAFDAMIKFLNEYRKETSSQDIGMLLKNMELLPDGTTREPRYWPLWSQCVEDTLSGKNTRHMLTFV